MLVPKVEGSALKLLLSLRKAYEGCVVRAETSV
jgi:hypothetical protein